MGGASEGLDVTAGDPLALQQQQFVDTLDLRRSAVSGGRGARKGKRKRSWGKGAAHEQEQEQGRQRSGTRTRREGEVGGGEKGERLRRRRRRRRTWEKSEKLLTF